MRSKSAFVLGIMLLFAIIHCAQAVELLVAEGHGYDYVLRYDGVTGNYLGKFSIEGSASKQPTAMAWGPDNNLYVAISEGTDKIVRYNGTTYEYLGVFGEASGSVLKDIPTAMAWGPDDNLYVAVDYGTDKVVKFDGITGKYLGVFGEANSGFGQLEDPTAMVFTPEPATLLLLGLGAVMLRRRHK